MKTALVLSGGGMFGAWQAGAWRALARTFQPDLVVGCSVGSLNGYAIAAGCTPDELCYWWSQPGVAGFRRLPEIIAGMMEKPLRREFALVVVDALRMKPRTIVGRDVTAAAILASCAVPGVIAPQRIGDSWYVDGGLLNPLPVWAAAELGATRIIALNVLPQMPSHVLAPVVKGFRAVFGHRPSLPVNVEVITLLPEGPLGTLKNAVVWDETCVKRWIDEGEQAVEQHFSIPRPS